MFHPRTLAYPYYLQYSLTALGCPTVEEAEKT
jgi:hypothetical protein